MEPSRCLPLVVPDWISQAKTTNSLENLHSLRVILAMRLHLASSLLTTLLTTLVLLVASSITSPLAYPNGKLEEINALRARGVPEV